MFITAMWCACAAGEGRCWQPVITKCHNDFESPFLAMLNQNSLSTHSDFPRANKMTKGMLNGYKTIGQVMYNIVKEVQ
jgi:hypothetical protein